MLTCTKGAKHSKIHEHCRNLKPEKDIKVWSAADVEVDLSTVGLKASPTNVFRSFTPKPKGKGTMLEGDSEKEVAQKLIVALKKKHII